VTGRPAGDGADARRRGTSTASSRPAIVVSNIDPGGLTRLRFELSFFVYCSAVLISTAFRFDPHAPTR
jgi:hypothetical protein